VGADFLATGFFLVLALLPVLVSCGAAAAKAPTAIANVNANAIPLFSRFIFPPSEFLRCITSKILIRLSFAVRLGGLMLSGLY
jgi:hypothetical protein